MAFLVSVASIPHFCSHMQGNQKIIIITAPSGAGKTSITRYLLNQFPQLAFSVSATTRSPRANEQEGVEYYFLTEDEFKERIKDDAFIEWEMVYTSKYYGTLKSEMDRIWQQQRFPVLDIDVKGAIHLMGLYPGQCLSIFIDVPSIDILRKRLEQRGTETLETIDTRIEKAAFEISHSHQFDQVIMNDDLQTACQQAAIIVGRFLGE